MTKQQWEEQAAEIDSQLSDMDCDDSYYQYLEVKRNACYSASVYAVDEQDLTEEEKEFNQ